jgi:ABC-type dipeptide/oligopeptide/nickel transport system ATPase component
MQIHLKNDERVVIVGATGSGKSVLAKHFLPRLNRVVVIDPKHTFRLDGFKIRKGLPALGSNWRMIYRPGKSEDGEMGDLFEQLFKLKNCTIYCDELATLTEKFPYATEVLGDIARTGRERHVSVWTALQRPRWVRVFFAEAESMFIFNLRGEDDRDYMSKFTAEIVREPIEKFTFWYYHPNNIDVALMRLNVSKNFIHKIG